MADGDLAPDWILKAALATQDTAHRSFVRAKPELRAKDEGRTLTVLGCGSIGTAIIQGLCTALRAQQNDRNESRNSATVSESPSRRLPSRFNACVRSPGSAEKVRNSLALFIPDPVAVFDHDHLSAVKEADVVILACTAESLHQVLGAEDLCKEIQGKLLISVVAGISTLQLFEIIYRGSNYSESERTIVRAAPNLAAAVRQSMTAIARSPLPLGEEKSDLIDGLFRSLGDVVYVSEDKLAISSALCGSGIAFGALFAESLAAVAMRSGLPRDDAYIMAQQVLRGAADLLQTGEHPAVLRDRACSPGSGASAGLQVLEDGAMRGLLSRAVSTVVNGDQQQSEWL